MRFRSILSFAAASVASLAIPTSVIAQTKVVVSMPAQGATVAKPKQVKLTFGEALLPPTVATSIVMTAMPGMKNQGEMVIRNFTTRWSDGNKTLTLALRQPLRAGSYDVRWQAAGADGHRMTGKISFTVS